MFNFIYESSPLTISLITIIFLIILIISYVNGMPVIKNTNQNLELQRTRISYIKSLGQLALVIGILGQLLGLYSSFSAMSTLVGGISSQILVDGLKVSTISTLYGMIIYIIAYLIWLGLSWKLRTE